jgi:hypothetical protein
VFGLSPEGTLPLSVWLQPEGCNCPTNERQRRARVSVCTDCVLLHAGSRAPIASGTTEDADVKTLIARAKQYSGFNFTREFGLPLWQRHGFDRVIRDDMELACTIGYVVGNPVRAGLASHPLLYPHLGSTQFQTIELLAMCDYGRFTPPSG